jgi:hypothetical protein
MISTRGRWPFLGCPLFLLSLSACGGSAALPDTAGDAGTSGEGGGASDAAPDAPATQDAGPSGSDAGNGVLSVALSSCIPTVYTASVTLGASQSFQMLVDTGSTTLGVASTGCSCGSASPVYTPGASATDEKQTATSQYGSGSWSGEIYQDTVSLGASPTAPTKLVAIKSEANFFQPLQCDSKAGGMQGILGMGPPGAALSGTEGFFDAFVATNKVPDVFATELCETTGTLWLGGFDPSATTAPPQYTPSNDLYSQYYYTVNLASIGVGGTTVPVASGQFTDSVVDTGTSVFLLGTTAYDALVKALQADAQVTKIFGASFFPPSNSQQPGCANASESKAALDAALPSLTLTFGTSPAITVKASATESYLFNAGGNTWCSAIVGIDQGATTFPLASIMGAPVLKSNVVIFDRGQKRIGFAPHAPCP